jgi:hypothetical protein
VTIDYTPNLGSKFVLEICYAAKNRGALIKSPRLKLVLELGPIGYLDYFHVPHPPLGEPSLWDVARGAMHQCLSVRGCQPRRSKRYGVNQETPVAPLELFQGS